MPNDRYAASFDTCVQTGPYDYQSVTRVLEVREDTTVGEIVAWFRKSEKTEAMRVFIGPLEASDAEA